MVIIFDGVCNLCNGAVNFIIDRDKKNIFKFASLQSAFGQNLLKEKNMNSTDFNTIVLLKNNKIYTKSTAIFEIFKELGFPYSMLSIFNIFPLFLTNKAYDFVAKNRYKFFGKRESCRIPTKELLDRFM